MQTFITIAVIFLIAAVYLLLHHLFPCKCGRTAMPYFYREHEKVGAMIAWALFYTVLAVLSLFDSSGPIMMFVIMMFTAYLWMKVYKHESGKIKKAAKALGRVVIKDNGRLAVET